MFRHRRQRRRWAARVLLLWLFGVAAGVANACLAPQAAHAGSPAIVNPVHLHQDVAASESARHHGTSQGHPHAGHTDPPAMPEGSSCQHFCDKAGMSIPPLKSPFDDLHGGAPLLPAVMVVRTPALLSLQRWVSRPDGMRAGPVRIAFLRLAL